MKKKAIITGIFGQDGSLLAEKLLSEGYLVYGFVKPDSDIKNRNNPQLREVFENCEICQIDICNFAKVKNLIKVIEPDELFHLAACHHSSQKGIDFDGDLHNVMFQVNSKSTINFIQSILELNNKCKLLFAGSSQMYTPGLSPDVIDETVPFLPSTFYGQTKVWGQQMIEFYRERYGLWGCTAILFNHESTRRSNQFVSRLITQAAAKTKFGIANKIELRNIYATADFSCAKDIVEGMHLMVSSDDPCDYVLSSGELKKIEDILSIAFLHLGLDWEKYIVRTTAEKQSNPGLKGDSSKIKRALDWKIKSDLKSWVCEMVDHDCSLLI
jgi:GDPmannose 4,6-dehydratase